MNQFRADLHIHSRFSRATSKDLTTRQLTAWARAKGIDVLGTGDFTHPAWLAELKETLEEDPRSGLFTMASGMGVARELPWLEGFRMPGRTHFMLQAEISCIYKKNGKVRKNHNVVIMPSFEAAERFNKRLAQVGNLESDGRPILGLDARNLLEMVLETDALAFLVPAHVWTPWFSLFGSKSGFDSIQECFGDLTPHIFALETGLSSDPEMNWMWSALDSFRMISNSDAHSGAKLARECNLFSGDVSYEGIFRSLRGEALGHKFLGTVEFFPEEGKYHLDGHRKCGVVLEPRETLAKGGICPVCGKPLTVGVLNRVTELADRDAPRQPAGQPGFVSLVPLPEIVGEVLGKGPATKAVTAFYAKLLMRFGPELTILQDTPLEDIAKLSAPLAEGIGRMRRGEVIRQPGYDGEYGVITVFTERERKEIRSGRILGGLGGPGGPGGPDAAPRVRRKAASAGDADAADATADSAPARGAAAAAPATPGAVSYNEPQQRAIEAGPGPVLVVAGPGTGKTQTLIGRVAALLDAGKNPRRVLAVTFTRRAAREMEERLVALFGESVSLPRADTLHSLAFEVWKNAWEDAPVLLSEDGARRVFAEANPGADAATLKTAWAALNLARERRMPDDPALAEFGELHHNYVKLKESWNLADYTDLLEFWLEQIDNAIYACPYTDVLVDEAQDLSALQLALVRGLVGAEGAGLFAIGDPRQSIYGFRGAHGRVREALEACWPDLTVIELTENYRSAQSLLDFSAGLFPGSGPLAAHAARPGAVRLFEAPTGRSEAAWIAERVRTLLGATSHSLADAARAARAGAQAAGTDGDEPAEAALAGSLAPGDVAVLVRFKALIPLIRATLDRAGVPCSAPEAEAFWAEPRVGAILAAAGRFLGIAGPAARGPERAENAENNDADADPLECPERVIAQGPLGIAAYMQDGHRFDALFWKGPEFKKLVRAFDELGGWTGLLNWVNLQSELEMVRARSEKVQVMSLHAAKGLEFEAVFLPALEDGILPFAGPGFFSGKATRNGDRPDQDEERRLLYVGLTRAKSLLYLSHAAARTLFGRELRLTPSRFFADLDDAAMKRSTLVAHTQRKEKQLNLL
ncbi:MAG: UvrD-helicase domain-containing protein [Desulfovibrionaceae bacterium]|jgi:uncharacterized protein (TIGR00375 family)|nr:UvrD-helicase domain-containing protein [Desulfovibrionaceae bacterium]